MVSSLAAAFTVRRREPVLVAPAKPTPHELKRLSDIDDQDSNRYHIPCILFYRSNSLTRGRDPARAIREALAAALVFYYPLAGRLREAPGGRLVVECTGEGVLFVEADADANLDQFSDADFLPPVRRLDELLHNVPGSEGVIDCPLILIQVTRFACGGFSFALRIIHTMCDAPGLVRFMSAVGEMARGAAAPTVPPVWARELLSARTPPRVTHAHPEFDEVPSDKAPVPFPDDDLVHKTLLFGPRDVAALRAQLQPRLHATATSFELVTACVWRSRTIALDLSADEEVRFVAIVNGRGRCHPPLPAGYYGNALALALAVSCSGKLRGNPLGYAVNLIQKAKAEITSDYLSSMADLMVLKGRPPPAVTACTYGVSDVRRAAFHEVDFGWGKPVYGGAAQSGLESMPGIGSFCSFFRSSDGEGKIVITVCLPSAAMKRFDVEIERMIKGGGEARFHLDVRSFRISAL